MPFKPVSPNLNFPKLEHEVLEFWDKRAIFKKSIDQREPRLPNGKKRPGAKGDWIFFDGPPGTNGRPHIGHMMQSALKDLWPRFKTMQGYRVLRKAGWDTHGLPIELQAEKELGLDSKRDIHSYGLTKYIGYCRNTVFRYLHDWEKAIRRIGRFVDTTDAYATLSNDYIQSDWWVVKQAHEKGLLYKDFKILPYCSRCGTGLSSHEVAQGYQEVTDTSVFVKLRLQDEPNTSLVIWTTTPWTLIANVAVAVGPKVKYVRVRHKPVAEDSAANVAHEAKKEERLIVAKELADSVLGEGNYEIEETFDGNALVGKHYLPPYNFFKPKEKAFYVVAEDFVTTKDGSGLVHMAAYGEDDFRVIKKYKLPLIQHLDLEGRMKKEVVQWSGKSFKEVDKEVTRDLKERGLLHRAQPHKHSYPFCWRCKTPLIYNAQSSWFIKTTAIRNKMIAANKKVNWQPRHIRDGRFGKWLEDNVDWAISRARYWGSPLPVWVCRECEKLTVVENLTELRKLSAEKLPPDDKIDLHKPFIDEVKLRCPHCKGEMTREPDVLDCWFNAGIMPWGQWGYPHKPGSHEMYKSQYPADFICEGIDQTRGWFYVLMATSTMLTGKSSFKNVICTELILDEKGRKMSKSVGNVVEPETIFEKFGADITRWTFFRTDPWLPSRFGERAIEESMTRLLRPLWNTYSFFVTYATIDGFVPDKKLVAPKSKHILDRWILAELDELIGTVTERLEEYDVTPAVAATEQFIQGLSNWYVRRGRRRYWKSENDGDKKSAEATLYYVLVQLSKLLAPMIPFVTDVMYRNLTEGGLYADERGSESVHLADWPETSKKKKDATLVAEMRLAQTLASLGRAARQDAKVRVRQPLARMLVALPGKSKLSSAVEELVRDEINVKAIEYAKSADELGTAQVKLNFKVAGKKFGPQVKEIQKLLVAGDVTIKGRQIKVGAFELTSADVTITYVGKKDLTVTGGNNVLVALDTKVSAELEQEGLVRELVRAVQDLRKEAGYDVSDRITLRVVSADPFVAKSLKAFGDFLKTETLATTLETTDGVADKKMDFVYEKYKAILSIKK
jgi:isoleucyl-tRNA synthetase